MANQRIIIKRIAVLLLFLFSAAAFVSAATFMSVQIQSAPVKGSPSAWGPLVETLSYGDRVKILKKTPGWVRIRSENGQEGWMSDVTLTPKRIVMSVSDNVSSGASTEEVALAGKGFNADVEKEYKAATDLDFTWVDRMESWAIPPEELADFLKAGDLAGGMQ